MNPDGIIYLFEGIEKSYVKIFDSYKQGKSGRTVLFFVCFSGYYITMTF
jgi:hypothetical protein